MCWHIISFLFYVSDNAFRNRSINYGRFLFVFISFLLTSLSFPLRVNYFYSTFYVNFSFVQFRFFFNYCTHCSSVADVDARKWNKEG